VEGAPIDVLKIGPAYLVAIEATAFAELTTLAHTS